MKTICVYCGSNKGFHQAYADAAAELGAYLAKKDIHLVYGAGNVGLMGVVADACLAAEGQVIGVIPEFLKAKEVYHPNIQQLLLTDTMYERKALMAQHADGFIALPGGFGTMDELFDMLTLGQLAQHQKPIGLLNVRGFFEGLILQLNKMVEEGFLKAKLRDMLLVREDIPALIDALENYQAPSLEKWI